MNGLQRPVDGYTRPCILCRAHVGLRVKTNVNGIDVTIVFGEMAIENHRWKDPVVVTYRRAMLPRRRSEGGSLAACHAVIHGMI